MTKAAFLDRDGTIVREYPDEEWPFVTEPEFLEGAIEGLVHFQTLGFKLIIVTNQPLINQKLITQAQYEEFTRKMLLTLQEHNVVIDEIRYCPHTPWENCICRKPRTGMVDAIKQKYPELRLDQSFIAGDSSADMGLADALKMKFFKIEPDAVSRGLGVVRSLRDIPSLL